MKEKLVLRERIFPYGKINIRFLEATMLMQVFTIFDEAAQESGEMFFAKNRVTAKRNFDNALKNVSPVSKSDYALSHLGSYDTETMKFEGMEPVRVHLNVEDANSAEVML